MDWTKAQMEALGEERLRLIREAQEKIKDKTGLERLDVFLEYGEALAQGGSLFKEEQKALLGGSISESAGRRPRTDAADHGTYGIVK